MALAGPRPYCRLRFGALSRPGNLRGAAANPRHTNSGDSKSRETKKRDYVGLVVGVGRIGLPCHHLEDDHHDAGFIACLAVGNKKPGTGWHLSGRGQFGNPFMTRANRHEHFRPFRRQSV